jgi:ATP synthase protein I
VPRASEVPVLRTAGLATAIVGLVCIIIGTVVKGADGFKGAVFATVLVIVFFSIGQMVVGGVLRRAPEMAMTVALMTYLIKIGVLFVIIILFANTTLFNTKVFAITVVSCTIAWVVAEVWVYSTTKVLYVEPEQRK